MTTKREKALATKKDKLRSRYCVACGQMIIYDGTQGRKRFCNNACKMSYHRWKQKHDEIRLGKREQRPAPDRTAQQMVNAVYANLAELETAL